MIRDNSAITTAFTIAVAVFGFQTPAGDLFYLFNGHSAEQQGPGFIFSCGFSPEKDFLAPPFGADRQFRPAFRITDLGYSRSPFFQVEEVKRDVGGEIIIRPQAVVANGDDLVGPYQQGQAQVAVFFPDPTATGDLLAGEKVAPLPGG